jgi:hypothetical protein
VRFEQVNDRPQYRELGQRLAQTLMQSGGGITTPARLQGLVGDLVADQQELLLPLKDLVCRPGFQALISRAGSGTGAIQRDVLLQNLEVTYSHRVVTAIGDVLDGFLDLVPETKAQLLALPSPTAQPPAGNYQPVSRTTPPQSTLPQLDSAASPIKHPADRSSVPRLVILSVLTATAIAAGVLLGRTPVLCQAVGLCSSTQRSRKVDEALNKAEQAAVDLRAASSLQKYEQAKDMLEQQLLLVKSESLTPEQEERFQQLDRTARDARTVVADEQRDALRLDMASKALASARESRGVERQALLATATESLNAIPPRSFSADQAREMRRKLEKLEQQAKSSESTPAEQASEPSPTQVLEGRPEPQPVPPPPPQPAYRPQAPAPRPIPARPRQPAAQPRPVLQPPPTPPQSLPPALEQQAEDAPYRERPLF